MKFEVVESVGEWIVRDDGEEIARFAAQEEALTYVALRLREAGTVGAASLAVRYAPRKD